jgi:phage/plasmid-associated DNA primase
VDEAMQRRFYMVPFRVTVPERERDKVLPEKLRAEWSGILEWMLEGCLEWQCVGLAPPAIVRETTCAYFGEEDALGRWLEECCTTGRQLWCEASRLWESWRGWCERNNEPVGSTKAFGVSLDQRGFSASKSCGNRGRNGINLGAE